MRRKTRQFIQVVTVGFASLMIAGAGLAAEPTVEIALKLRPVQTGDVDYDQPDDPKECSLKGHNSGKTTGWHVYSDAQQLLRRFLDTNGDGKVDQWCYYKNGVEVYRDVDADFNGKADQFRWMGTAGIRWGVDEDEDGTIDRWKVISPEEVTAETVAAIQQSDPARFERLLISERELENLGLSDSQLKDIQARLTAAKKDFPNLAKAQRKVGAKAKWIHFGGSQPGLIPAGTKGNSADIYVYDNVSAVIADEDGKHAQVAVGTLVQVGRGWRLIDLPSALDQTQVARGGYFFQELLTNDLANAQAQAGAISPQMQKMIASLTEIDKKIQAATTITTKARLNDERAELLLEIVKSAPNSEDRNIWIQQFADTVGAAIQQGAFPKGIQHLKRLSETVLKPNETEHVAHVEFVILTAEYDRQMNAAQTDDEKIGKLHEKWLEDLAEFVKKFPNSEDTPEALLQLAFHEEFSGKQDTAIEYYTRIVKDFPSARVYAKAAGAKRRLESVGRPLELTGKDINNRNRAFKLSDLKGKVVLVHYWATWCDVCNEDMESIRKAQAKYGRKGFTPVGINCDSDGGEVGTFLKRKRLPWVQLYEPNGLDNRLANELGVLSLPTMLLIDKNGRVINNNIHASELESELEKLFR